MARRLGGDNILIIQDNISDTQIHLKYRMPTTGEIISYRNGSTKRVRNQLVSRVGENRLEHGKKILTGFREGDFERYIDGKWTFISSNPRSDHYDPSWKDLVAEQAPDLIETLAVHVFDASSQVIQQEVEDDGEDIEGN